MVEFILHILCAVLFTLAAFRTTYEESKRMYSFGSFLLWSCVVIDIINFI